MTLYTTPPPPDFRVFTTDHEGRPATAYSFTVDGDEYTRKVLGTSDATVQVMRLLAFQAHGAVKAGGSSEWFDVEVAASSAGLRPHPDWGIE